MLCCFFLLAFNFKGWQTVNTKTSLYCSTVICPTVVNKSLLFCLLLNKAHYFWKRLSKQKIVPFYVAATEWIKLYLSWCFGFFFLFSWQMKWLISENISWFWIFFKGGSTKFLEALFSNILYFHTDVSCKPGGQSQNHRTVRTGRDLWRSCSSTPKWVIFKDLRISSWPVTNKQATSYEEP